VPEKIGGRSKGGGGGRGRNEERGQINLGTPVRFGKKMIVKNVLYTQVYPILKKGGAAGNHGLGQKNGVLRGG